MSEKAVREEVGNAAYLSDVEAVGTGVAISRMVARFHHAGAVEPPKWSEEKSREVVIDGCKVQMAGW